MKLQVAIDRTDLETAEAMIEEIKESADIIEIGTSLIKDYGLDRSVAYFRKRFPEQCFLADIKTCDEGAYEFRKTYEAGGDIPTVMGFSSVTTIRACADVAREFGGCFLYSPSVRQTGGRARGTGQKQRQRALGSPKDSGSRRRNT